MKQFTQAFWIARKNNLTLHYCKFQDKWVVCTFEETRGLLDLYQYTKEEVFIDFFNGKCKFLDSWTSPKQY